MKNNLFLISESEKSRILNMHKKATNSLYLSEQAAQPAAAQPAQVPTDLKSVADIQNFLIGKGFDVGKTGADEHLLRGEQPQRQEHLLRGEQHRQRRHKQRQHRQRQHKQHKQ